MGHRVPQLIFSRSNVVDKSIVDKGAMICAAPAGRVGTDISKGHLLAAVTHQGNCRWVPLIGPAKGGFVGFVVAFDSYGDPRHTLVPSHRLTRLGRIVKDSIAVAPEL
jgi:hypothetical protein